MVFGKIKIILHCNIWTFPIILQISTTCQSAVTGKCHLFEWMNRGLHSANCVNLKYLRWPRNFPINLLLPFYFIIASVTKPAKIVTWKIVMVYMRMTLLLQWTKFCPFNPESKLWMRMLELLNHFQVIFSRIDNFPSFPPTSHVRAWHCSARVHSK